MRNYLWFLLFALLTMSVSSCARLTFAWADLKPDGAPAAPAVLGSLLDTGPISSRDQWEHERVPAIKALLQSHIYGHFPDSHELIIENHSILDEKAFNGAGRLEEYKLKARLRFGQSVQETDSFYMNVVNPVGVIDAPVILMQTFCPRWDTLTHPAVSRPKDAGKCLGGGPIESVMTYVFGRYIATPPIDMILAEGYAVATIFPSEFAPDSRVRGKEALRQLSAGLPPGKERWGAIAAWAWGFSLMVDALEKERAAPGQYISWGHSRYAKAALLAAAFDARINGVISHQSGTGGASLNRRKKGESVKAITQNYPHWFADRYAGYAGEEERLPIDQHHLLALIAPRPVLLGNARRDVWSDPNGAFRAAMGADPVYALLGSDGLEQSRLEAWKPEADIAFWLRPGTHGVVREDWPAFIEFLNAHFQ